jgi:hypothetical protein
MRGDVLLINCFTGGINVGGVCVVCCILRLNQLLFYKYNVSVNNTKLLFCIQ